MKAFKGVTRPWLGARGLNICTSKDAGSTAFFAIGSMEIVGFYVDVVSPKSSTHLHLHLLRDHVLR